jgi:pimeloyl-ACP methyl ester carboxylesterase
MLANAGFRAVAPYTRGYFPTEIPTDSDYSIRALAADANEIHEQLGDDQPGVVIGHDWGALTVYEAATTAPERWRRAVTMSAAPFGVEIPRTFRRAQARFYSLLNRTNDAETVIAADDFEFVEQLWRLWSPGTDHRLYVEAAKNALRPPGHLSAALGYYRAMARHPRWEGGMERVAYDFPSIPLLYIHGNDDGCALADGLEPLVTSYLPPESQASFLDDAGHFVHLDQPRRVKQLILDWFGEAAED